MALTAFAMKGRSQAIAVTTVLAMFAFIIAPLTLVSSAMVALTVLRQGWREGFVIVAGSLVAIAVLGNLIFGMPMAVAIVGLFLWLPAFAFASYLRASRSLRKGLEALAIAAVALVAAQYMLLGEPVVFWSELLNEYFDKQLDPAMLEGIDRDALITAWSTWMPGLLAASWFLGNALSLLMACYWDASLDGRSFSQEFYNLKFSRWTLLALPILLLAVAVDDSPGFFSQLSTLAASLYLIQGLAVLQGFIAAYKLARYWLYGLYFVLIFVGLYGAILIAAVGYADGWINFRAKALAEPDNKSDG